MLKVLDERQRQIWQNLTGEPISVLLRPTQYPESILGQFRDRKRNLNKYHKIMNKYFSFLELLSVPEIVKDLELTPTVQTKVTRLPQKYQSEENRMGGPLKCCRPPDFRTREQWIIGYALAMDDFENEVVKVLPTEKFIRLEQIRQQFQGLGILTGTKNSKRFGLSKEMVKRIHTRGSEIVGAFHEAGETMSPEQYIAEAAKLRGRIESAIWELLTPGQREKWQREIGKPLTKEFLDNCRKIIPNGPKDIITPALGDFEFAHRAQPMIPEFTAP